MREGDTIQWIPAGPAVLFAPADKPERFAKAAARADVVILDLEDGCRREERAAAREHIAASTLDPQRTIVRVNPPGSPDCDLDCAMVTATHYRTIMVPKVQSVDDVERIAAALPGCGIIALVESPRGVLNLQEIAEHPAVVALFWGAEDITAAVGGTSSRYSRHEVPTVGGGISGHPGGYREVPRHVRTMVLLHAAAAGKIALDAIHADIHDLEGARAEATDAAASGFAATVAIHPALVPAIREAYAPTPAQCAWAREVVAGARNNSGAFTVDGRMIDLPLLRQAEILLARAANSGN